MKCEVVGQSFMLHQIRKLIGGMLAVVRGVRSESFIDEALTRRAVLGAPPRLSAGSRALGLRKLLAAGLPERTQVRA